MNKKFCAVVLLITSVVSTLSGLIVVVVSADAYVVPYQQTENFTLAQCTVTLICLDASSAGCNDSVPPGADYACVRVRVEYVDYTGTPAVGTLFSSSWNYYTTRQKRCFCQSCSSLVKDNSTRIQVPSGGTLQSGQTVTCFYNPQNFADVVLERTSFQSAMHAMLWPTVMFIVGSVVLVLSGLETLKLRFECQNDALTEPTPEEFELSKATSREWLYHLMRTPRPSIDPAVP